jgi:ATP-dependent protease HslVU (ClpYQ) peptidase subunit
LTIIVAVRDAETNSVILGADSQVSAAGTKLYLEEGGPLKIGQNGEYLIGTAGRLRTGQVLLHTDLPHPPPEVQSARDVDTFMILNFAKEAQAILAEAGIEVVVDAERLMTESEIIVCVRGMPYTIGEDYSVMRGEKISDRFTIAVTGSGYQLALGAAYGLLSALENPTPEMLLNIMLEAAARWDSGCGGQFYTIRQQG